MALTAHIRANEAHTIYIFVRVTQCQASGTVIRYLDLLAPMYSELPVISTYTITTHVILSLAARHIRVVSNVTSSSFFSNILYFSIASLLSFLLHTILQNFLFFSSVAMHISLLSYGVSGIYFTWLCYISSYFT